MKFLNPPGLVTPDRLQRQPGNLERRLTLRHQRTVLLNHPIQKFKCVARLLHLIECIDQNRVRHIILKQIAQLPRPRKRPRK